MRFHAEHHKHFTAIYWRGVLAAMIHGGSEADRRRMTEDELSAAATSVADGW